MITRNFLLLAFLTIFPLAAFADDSDQLCTAGGYYAGAQENFLSGFAMHILQKRKVLVSTKCRALWQAAFDVGQRFSQTGRSKPEESPVFDDAGAFSSRVYSSIAKGAGY